MRVYWAVWRETDVHLARADAVGYLTASVALMKAAAEAGVEMVERPEDAEVIMYFCHPFTFFEFYEWLKHLPAKHVLYTMYESTPVPDTFYQAFRLADAVVAPTTFVQKALFSSKMPPGRKPYLAPLGFDAGIYKPRKPAREWDMSSKDPFRFLYLGAPNRRKGWDRILSIWISAFADSEFMSLTLKTTTAKRGEEGLARRGNVMVDTRFLSREELRDLMYSHHCLLAPSMGEGFGLVPLEALATGMPVISTRYGGVLDFLTPQNAYFCEHTMDNVAQRQGSAMDVFHGACANPASLGREMVRVMRDYPAALEKAALGARQMHAAWTWHEAGMRLRNTLTAILAEGETGTTGGRDVSRIDPAHRGKRRQRQRQGHNQDLLQADVHAEDPDPGVLG